MPFAPETHSQQRAKVRNKLLDKQRPNSAQRGYNQRWRNYRKGYLALHPLCVECKDRTVSATVVDHIISHKGNWELFWDTDNHQSLCKPHHDRKTAKERWGKKDSDG